MLRPQLAHAGSLPPDPLFPLFQQACRLSLHPAADPSPFLLALSTLPPDTDPLWPALARHICRRSTPEDRALLIDLAQHPEQREGPLSWGLQVLVRGDVYQPDGTWLTLDELSAQAGLDPLPYLEDMPDELELPDDL